MSWYLKLEEDYIFKFRGIRYSFTMYAKHNSNFW
jgi:hypothetical protein